MLQDPRQTQFLNVVTRDEATVRFQQHLKLEPLGRQNVPLGAALGRILAEDIRSAVDVPGFDRSNVDGFAVIAADTFGASEEVPRRVRLASEIIHTGIVPTTETTRGNAVAIATGGMMPRGADAVVMVENAHVDGQELRIGRAVTAGSGVSFAGTDVTAGEIVLRRGQILASRDTGVLAAIGVTAVDVWRRPIVAIISTGDEIIPPGEPMQPARVYDSNAQVIADAVRELGGEPRRFGIVRDDLDALRGRLGEALEVADVVLLSGGTSKGAGDVSYRVVAELTDPGIVAHGVALKPGKPICLAATGGRPVVVLPGFPTSAIFTFHEFVAPVLTAMSGRGIQARAVVPATLSVRVNSEIGRTEYLLVGLVEAAQNPRSDSGSRIAHSADHALVAYPMGQGSGSVTTFSRADGFTIIGRHDEIVPAGTIIDVHLLSPELQLADLVVIGSHCVGLDYLLSELEQRGIRPKFVAVGSLAGLEAAKRGECDLAGIHLLDPHTGEYNRPFLTRTLELIAGYGRMQGIVFRKGDQRFEERSAGDAIAMALRDPACMMVNRNQGSGTRALIDRLLGGARPPGYAIQPRNHNAVAAAVRQRRADWGVTLDTIARNAGLGFIPVQHEDYDFVTPKSRADRPAVRAFRTLLGQAGTREALIRLGMKV